MTTSNDEAPGGLAELSPASISKHLNDLPGWTFESNSLNKDFHFDSFRNAVSFIVRLSFEAEELNHHPELFNVYSTVRIQLKTHDAGDRVTAMDIELARRIESISHS